MTETFKSRRLIDREVEFIIIFGPYLYIYIKNIAKRIAFSYIKLTIFDASETYLKQSVIVITV